MARTLTARLQQRERPNSARLFELFDDRFLRVRRLSAGRRSEYAMDIAILAPETLRRHVRPWPWLIASGTCATVALGTALMAMLGTDHRVSFAVLTTTLLVIAVAAVAQFRRQSHHLLTLHSRLATVTLVEILADEPRSPDVATFIDHLIRSINDTVADKKLAADDLRAGELRSLRKLAESQVIDLATYEQAKRRLLSLAL